MRNLLGAPARGALSGLAAILIAAGTGGTAMAQTRTDCEAGIATVKGRLTQATDGGQRAELSRALRHAERELGEEQYDECMEALEDVGITTAGGTAASAPPQRPAEPDERVGADPGLPVTVEDAFVPSPGETEAKLRFFYDRVRPVTVGDDDDSRTFGRHLTTPEAEVEVGIARGLSASVVANYSLGNAQEAKSGEVEFGAKWNLLPLQGLRPAVTLGASVGVPYGYNNGPVNTALTLYVSQPLGSSADAPFLHANVSWVHAYDREEDDRANRFVGVLGVAVPVAASTALVTDLVHEQQDEKGKVNRLVELGVRQVLPHDMVLGAGVGAGFGNSSTRFRALVGLQKGF